MRKTHRVTFYVGNETYERAVRYANSIRLKVNELAKTVFLQELINYYIKGVRHGEPVSGDAEDIRKDSATETLR